MRELSSPINKVVQFGLNHKALQVSCGDAFTLILDDKNQVYAFGKGTHGRLGMGNLAEVENMNEPIMLETLKNEKVI